MREDITPSFSQRKYYTLLISSSFQVKCHHPSRLLPGKKKEPVYVTDSIAILFAASG